MSTLLGEIKDNLYVHLWRVVATMIGMTMIVLFTILVFEMYNPLYEYAWWFVAVMLGMTMIVLPTILVFDYQSRWNEPEGSRTPVARGD